DVLRFMECRQSASEQEKAMKCRYCGQPARLTPMRDKSLRRFHAFMLLAAALLLAAVVVWMLDIAIWPWWIGGTGLFVLSQALMKWQESRWMICESGQHGYTFLGRISRSTAGSARGES